MDVTEIARFVGAFGLVLGLIALSAFLARRGGLMQGGRGRGTGRLGIVESLALDPKHRLVLIRRDDREHLLVLGQTTDLVVEAGIAPPAEAERDTPAEVAP